MPTPTPETIAYMRARYAAGDPVPAILAAAHVSSGALYYWIDGGPDDGEGPRLPPLPRRNRYGVRRGSTRMPTRAAVVKRLWRTAEWQVRDIEDRMRRNQQQPDERERDARLLAVIVKTVRELGAMRDKDEQDQAADNLGLDDFRRELARKIDALVEGQRAATDRGDELG
jgi:hypothetical protein